MPFIRFPPGRVIEGFLRSAITSANFLLPSRLFIEARQRPTGCKTRGAKWKLEIPLWYLDRPRTRERKRRIKVGGELAK